MGIIIRYFGLSITTSFSYLCMKPLISFVLSQIYRFSLFIEYRSFSSHSNYSFLYHEYHFSFLSLMCFSLMLLFKLRCRLICFDFVSSIYLNENFWEISTAWFDFFVLGNLKYSTYLWMSWVLIFSTIFLSLASLVERELDFLLYWLSSWLKGTSQHILKRTEWKGN